MILPALVPCPACHTLDHVKIRMLSEVHRMWFTCEGCGLIGLVDTDADYIEAYRKAVAGWNAACAAYCAQTTREDG